MTTKQAKLIAKLTATVEKVFESDEINVVFQECGKIFCLLIESDGSFTIRRAWKDEQGWQLGYASANGKTLRFIDNFIAKRA